jgi:hypothetical protein
MGMQISRGVYTEVSEESVVSTVAEELGTVLRELVKRQESEAPIRFRWSGQFSPRRGGCD